MKEDPSYLPLFNVIIPYPRVMFEKFIREKGRFGGRIRIRFKVNEILTIC